MREREGEEEWKRVEVSTVRVMDGIRLEKADEDHSTVTGANAGMDLFYVMHVEELDS